MLVKAKVTYVPVKVCS